LLCLLYLCHREGLWRVWTIDNIIKLAITLL
jgi:hypothetical protein